ncbi:MAG: 16S rRNA (guanine(966)-N(2))-methyltransferase RsmD [Pseudomonadota bacterium]|nr:16S rRNA (guanine(966)-N(2))-methyltransferase RsmD [Pseudomonadota bacterium]
MSGKKRGNRGSPSGRLRIVAGKWRSRLLPVADVPGLRPTAERIRETLFNWIAPTIEGTRCLDLFAGTGALGLEALSRGALFLDLVEVSPVAVSQLRENAMQLAAENVKIHQTDAFAFLETRRSGQQFDIVFLDPPFSDGRYQDLCKLLDECGWLSLGAFVYIEQDREQFSPVLPHGWETVREKTAGNVRYSLLRKAA